MAGGTRNFGGLYRVTVMPPSTRAAKAARAARSATRRADLPRPVQRVLRRAAVDRELSGAYFAGGATAYIAPAGAPFGYASAFAPLMLFYELTEGCSLEEAVQRLRDHDHELSMWQLFRP